jgi:hypothetical protein
MGINTHGILSHFIKPSTFANIPKEHGFDSAQPSVFIGSCLSGAEGDHHKGKSLSKRH